MKNDYTDLITVKGLVIPTRWDKEGNVIGLAIADYNENESLVLMDEVGKSLKDLLHEKVIISGKKVKTEDTEQIKVNSFHINSI